MTSAVPTVLATMLAIVVMSGAVTAVAAREPRVAVLGLMIALAGAPFLADPFPDARGIVARIAGAALVAELLLVGARDEPAVAGSRLAAWPAAVLVTVTAAVTAGLGGLSSASDPGLGGAALAATPFLPAAAAGTALLVVAAPPVLLGREPLRLTIGLLLAVTGALLVRTSIDGPASPFAELSVALLLGLLAGAGALLHGIARQSRRQPGRT